MAADEIDDLGELTGAQHHAEEDPAFSFQSSVPSLLSHHQEVT
jgi:hypothetical protein